MKKYAHLAIMAIVFVILFFLIKNLVDNWQRIPFDALRFDVISVIVSFILLLVNFLIFVEGWRAILRKFQAHIRYPNAFWIMSSSQIAKYVPGGIWFALGRVILGRREKLKEEIVAVSVVIETGLTFVVGILLFAVSVVLTNREYTAMFWYIIPILLVFLIILYPPLLGSMMNLGLRIIKRRPVQLDITYVQILQLSVYFVGIWVTQILGFYFLINAVFPIPLLRIFNLAAAYTLSWITGFVVPFAPAGLGVREAMMTLLLSSVVPTPLAIAVSFVARAWITIFELLTFFIGILVKKL